MIATQKITARVATERTAPILPTTASIYKSKTSVKNLESFKVVWQLQQDENGIIVYIDHVSATNVA